MNKKGFTLIEVVVASLILVIAFTILSQVVVFSLNYFQDEYSETLSQEDLRLVAVTFEKDIRKFVYQINETDSNYFTDDGTTITLGNVNPDTNNNNGCYVKYVFNSSTNTIIRDEYDNYNLVSSQEVGRSIKSYSTTNNFNTGGPYYVSFYIEAIDDERVTDNDIEQTIYLRLAVSGEAN